MFFEEFDMRNGLQLLDAVSIGFALLLMGGVVFAKLLTSQLIGRMKRQIATVEQEKQKITGQLKVAQSQKNIAAKNKVSLEKKKVKLQKRLTRMKRELGELKDEHDHRQKVRDTMRGKLIRPTGAEAEVEEV